MFLKSRYTGRTGYAGSFTFDNKTGRLIELDDTIKDVELRMMSCSN